MIDDTVGGAEVPSTHVRQGWVWDTTRLAPLLVRATAVLVSVSLLSALLTSFLPNLPAGELTHRIVSIDEEQNLPTLFSVLLFLLCATLAAAVAVQARAARQRGVVAWWSIAGLAGLAATDEFAEIHESVNYHISHAGLVQASGVLTFPGVVVALVALPLLAVVYLRFILRLQKQVRWWLVGAASVYVTGAVGVDMVGAMVRETTGGKGLLFQIVSTAEESMEMLGLIALAHALVLALGLLNGSTRVHLAVVGSD